MNDQFRTKRDGDTLHIAMAYSRLDASSAAEIKARLAGAFDVGVQRVEIDLAPVGFVDSSGVGILLSIYRRLPPAGAVVVLRNVQPGVLAVLELLRLQRVFTIE